MLVGQTIGTGSQRFAIEQELGSGAMGTVYRATFLQDDKARRPVALKVVALGLLGNEGAMARFTREAAILKQLRHPHIVRLYATGHYRKTPFIAMEFIDGEALDRALARRGRLSWEEVVAHGKQLCEALQHAHEKGIIHRDLKPSNLMITRDGTLKLTDFGIAKDTDVTALTGANSTIGTAAYMSPEQCKGDRNLTAKSDLYSLGIVFFELLSGRKPFVADSTVDMFLKHVNEKPPRVGKIVQELPPKLESLILQMLEKDKENRPTDAAWVGRMLAEIEEDAFARKSAGLEAATGRKDRPQQRGSDVVPVSEADRDAARALKGVVKKKKKKKPAVPLREKTWPKAAGISVLLLGIAVGVYFATRPPSAESLAAALDETRPEDSLPAAEAYLKRYGDRPGELTERAAKVFREAKVRQRAAVLLRRFGNEKYRANSEGEDKEAYAAAMDAIQAEKDGRLTDAETLWNHVKVRFPEEAKLPYTLDEDKLAKARWGWLADERIRGISHARTRLRELDSQISQNRINDKPMPYDPGDPASVAVKARRLEQFKDFEKAGRLWDAVITQTEKDADHRALYLVACEQKRVMPKETADNSIGNRRALVQKQTDDAAKRLDELKAGQTTRRDWINLRAFCRDIVELYEDETDAQINQLVGRAKKLIDETARES